MERTLDTWQVYRRRCASIKVEAIEAAVLTYLATGISKVFPVVYIIGEGIGRFLASAVATTRLILLSCILANLCIRLGCGLLFKSISSFWIADGGNTSIESVPTYALSSSSATGTGSGRGNRRGTTTGRGSSASQQSSSGTRKLPVSLSDIEGFDDWGDGDAGDDDDQKEKVPRHERERKGAADSSQRVLVLIPQELYEECRNTLEQVGAAQARCLHRGRHNAVHSPRPSEDGSLYEILDPVNFAEVIGTLLDGRQRGEWPQELARSGITEHLTDRQALFGRIVLVWVSRALFEDIERDVGPFNQLSALAYHLHGVPGYITAFREFIELTADTGHNQFPSFLHTLLFHSEESSSAVDHDNRTTRGSSHSDGRSRTNGDPVATRASARIAAKKGTATVREEVNEQQEKRHMGPSVEAAGASTGVTVARKDEGKQLSSEKPLGDDTESIKDKENDDHCDDESEEGEGEGNSRQEEEEEGDPTLRSPRTLTFGSVRILGHSARSHLSESVTKRSQPTRAAHPKGSTAGGGNGGGDDDGESDGDSSEESGATKECITCQQGLPSGYPADECLNCAEKRDNRSGIRVECRMCGAYKHRMELREGCCSLCHKAVVTSRNEHHNFCRPGVQAKQSKPISKGEDDESGGRPASNRPIGHSTLTEQLQQRRATNSRVIDLQQIAHDLARQYKPQAKAQKGITIATKLYDPNTGNGAQFLNLLSDHLAQHRLSATSIEGLITSLQAGELLVPKDRNILSNARLAKMPLLKNPPDEATDEQLKEALERHLLYYLQEFYKPPRPDTLRASLADVTLVGGEVGLYRFFTELMAIFMAQFPKDTEQPEKVPQEVFSRFEEEVARNIREDSKYMRTFYNAMREEETDNERLGIVKSELSLIFATLKRLRDQAEGEQKSRYAGRSPSRERNVRSAGGYGTTLQDVSDNSSSNPTSDRHDPSFIESQQRTAYTTDTDNSHQQRIVDCDNRMARVNIHASSVNTSTASATSTGVPRKQSNFTRTPQQVLENIREVRNTGDYARCDLGDTVEDQALFFQLLENECFADAQKETDILRARAEENKRQAEESKRQATLIQRIEELEHKVSYSEQADCWETPTATVHGGFTPSSSNRTGQQQPPQQYQQRRIQCADCRSYDHAAADCPYFDPIERSANKEALARLESYKSDEILRRMFSDGALQRLKDDREGQERVRREVGDRRAAMGGKSTSATTGKSVTFGRGTDKGAGGGSGGTT
jgi:hypothetical protein